MSAIPRPAGLLAETGPIAPKAAPARHGAGVGATGDLRELDPHERLADLFARLAAVFGEAAQVCGELAQVELAAGAETRLMLPVPEALRTRQLLTVTGLAELLSVDGKTIRAWRERGQLPAAVKIGGVIRWDADDIDRWIAEKREAAQ